MLFLPSLANRHGLITGATGTGKTVTLQVLADRFSQLGVPVFVADVKGDLSGVAAAGAMSPKLAERLKATGIRRAGVGRRARSSFWDVFGKRGFPVRATISDLGPLLLGRLFGLNATQQGVLALVFKIADDNGLLLLDLKDLRAMLQFAGDNASTVHDRVRQHLRRLHRRHPARAAGDRPAGRRLVLRRADARRRRPAADRRARPGHGQRPRRRRADPIAEALRDVPALDAVGAVRAAAGGRRSRQAGAGVLLRRGAPAVHRCAAAAGREDRTGRAPDPIERGRRRTS